MADALMRHMTSSLHGTERARIAVDSYFVNQYFPNHDHHSEAGYDPRKHAISACYLADFPDNAQPVAWGSEARWFAWFAIADLPPDAELWPGTKLMIDRPEVRGESTTS